MTGMKALVTGGAGFIGSNLVNALVERGDDVRVLDNFSTGNRGNLEGLDVEVVEGELRSYERVHAAVRGVEVVYHLGALGSVAPPLQIAANTVESGVNYLPVAYPANLVIPASRGPPRPAIRSATAAVSRRG